MTSWNHTILGLGFKNCTLNMNKKFKNYINRYLNQNVKPQRFT